MTTRTRAAVLAGIGGAVPSRVVTNEELVKTIDSTDEWIRSRTGIHRRHFAAPGTATSDLAIEAGAVALKSAGREHVDTVVVATTTPDRPCPATAPTVATGLGCGAVAAYDVSAVCTGFVYALATVAGLIATGVSDSALVIGAETFSSILNPEDRSTFAVFGDGAGAVVLRAGDPEEPGAIGPFHLGSDGTGRDLITVRAGGSAQRLSGKPVEHADQYFTMAGQEVFWRAVQRMEESSRAVLELAGWTVADVDRFVCHQANQRILNRLCDALGIDGAKAVANIADVGNTAAASIPLALYDAATAGVLRPGDRLLLTAFGGGLTWGSTVLSWPRLPEA